MSSSVSAEFWRSRTAIRIANPRKLTPERASFDLWLKDASMFRMFRVSTKSLSHTSDHLSPSDRSTAAHYYSPLNTQ